MAKTVPFETHAKISVGLGALGAVAVVAVAAMLFQAFRPEDFEVVMAKGGMRFFAILGGVAVSLVCAVVGCLLGFTSAGQKRNAKNGLSWLGFFLNAGVIMLALCLFIFFWAAKDLRAIGGG